MTVANRDNAHTPLSEAHLTVITLSRLFLMLLLFGLALPAQAELKRFGPSSNSNTFIRAEEAFRVTPSEEATGLRLEFHVTPGYYLYRDRFHFTAEGTGLTVGEPVFSAEGEWKEDASFGRVRVYHENVSVTLPLKGRGQVNVVWQGCADAGLCYPPQHEVMSFGDVAPVAADAATDRVTATTVAAQSTTLTTTALASLATKSRLAQLFLMFALGLGLAFTPCVLPMLPILAGLIARQHTGSALRGFLLALSYVLGVAAVYALTGFAVGMFGQQVSLPTLFQHPLVLGIFSLLFFTLALSLFGLFELRLPSALHNHFDGLSRRQKGGALAGSFLVGMFSALVVSPCISAPLFGVLLHISVTGDAVFGALSLFWMAIGMGVPLLLLGATEGRLLPKAGAWMNEVKTFFGFLLVFVATELLTRLVPAPVALGLYGICTAATGFWLWRLYAERNGLGLLLRGLAFCVLVYAAALVGGAASGGDDPLRPLAGLGGGTQAAKATAFIHIKTGADLDREIALAKSQGMPLMLDFYADWCVSCKVMERNVFRDAHVVPRLQKIRLVQADITANDADDRALLKRFSLFGPPALVFFDRKGEELSSAHLVGETDRAGFIAHLDKTGM
ncbi:MAG: protein-disulfide reductase DsbD [bacterium]|nr:protein-disulfide reductase DsbD [bacterium]